MAIDIMEEVFQPMRLAQARRRRGLTKTQLAMASGLSARSVTAYETGEYSPGEEAIASLAEALEFPRRFFFRPEPSTIRAESASFRALTKMTAAQRDSVLAAGEIALELDNWIDQRFVRPLPAVPDLRGMEPQAAAEAVRAEWGLGLRPLPNMIHLLEAHGVRVYSLVHDRREVDAFSLWNDETPFVFLNTIKTAERSRFDAAHELGHLVLHQHGAPNGKLAEEEADKFAAAFLLPAAQIAAKAPRLPTLQSIISAKREWGVSALAYVHRLHSLELISYWHYRQLCIQLRSRFKSSEPQGIPRESSQILAKIFAELRRRGIGRPEIARDLSITVTDLDDLTFGLVLTPVEGGRSAVSEPKPSPPSLKVF